MNDNTHWSDKLGSVKKMKAIQPIRDEMKLLREASVKNEENYLKAQRNLNNTGDYAVYISLGLAIIALVGALLWLN